VSRVGPGVVHAAAPGRRTAVRQPSAEPWGVSLTRREVTSIGSFVSPGPSCAAGANVPLRGIRVSGLFGRQGIRVCGRAHTVLREG
jgi:hypothetical protein